MSYHSETLAFKKAELLAVLQAIDSGFNFETIEPIQVKEVVASNNRTGLDNYKTLLFKKPLLSIYESASIISEINPCLIVACNNEYESKIEYPNWGNALNYIESCINSGLLERDEFNINCIKRDDLKAFLASQDIIVVGFNDNLPTQEPIGYGRSSIQQIEPNIESLNAEITKLTKLIVEKNDEIDKLKKDFEKENQSCFDLFLDKASLEKENAELKEKIKDLEYDQSKKIDLLALILDETQTDRYAPDLAYSINFWLDAYINNPKVDSHNNKANTWIKKNTPYSGEQDDTPTRRIREIATPFKDLHQSRKKLLENR